jgi:ribosomal protein S18 acetylase RimI-like enzyme
VTVASTTRPFRDWDDLRAMQAVCSAGLLASPGRAAAHPGDIAWSAGWPRHPAERLAEMFLLWEQGDRLSGFAAFMPDDGDLSVFVTPDLRESDEAIGFEETVVGWASGQGGPVLWAEFEDETAAVERWRARGFRPTEAGYLNLTRSLDEEDHRPRDDRVQPVGEDDVEDRAAVTHAGFEVTMPFAEYTAAYAGFRGSPAYPHGWDLLLRDADGRPAACCIAWTDAVSRAGTFEPVAAHPDMHRRGFGTALLLDGIRRFAEAGMTYAIVGVEVDNPGAEALYRSVGFAPDRLLRVYEHP